MIALFFSWLFACPAMEWGPRSQAYPYGVYVAYSGSFFVAVQEVPGDHVPPVGLGNDSYYAGAYCAEANIPNDSVPQDTTEVQPPVNPGSANFAAFLGLGIGVGLLLGVTPAVFRNIRQVMGARVRR